MTNVLVGYPDIPFYSISFDQSDAYEQPQNLSHGPRHIYSHPTGTQTGTTLDWDLGNDFANKQNTANYLAILGANHLIDDGIENVSLQYASTFGSWTNAYSTATFQNSTLYGPRSTDFIEDITSTPARQFWRLNLSVGSGTSYIVCSKIFFGTWWDPGIEPDYRLDYEHPRSPAWQSDSGATHFIKHEEGRYRIRMIWRGVSDADANTFSQKILRYGHINPVIIYTSDFHDVLDDQRVLYCRIYNGNIQKSQGIADYNTVECEFVEDVG